MKIQWQRLATTGRTSPWVPLSQDPVRRICASCAPHQKLPNSCFFRSWGAYDTPGNLREPWENHGKMVMYDDLWWFNGNTIGKCASEKGPLWVDLPWFSDYTWWFSIAMVVYQRLNPTLILPALVAGQFVGFLGWSSEWLYAQQAHDRNEHDSMTFQVANGRHSCIINLPRCAYLRSFATYHIP